MPARHHDTVAWKTTQPFPRLEHHKKKVDEAAPSSTLPRPYQA